MNALHHLKVLSDHILVFSKFINNILQLVEATLKQFSTPDKLVAFFFEIHYLHCSCFYRKN